MDICKKCDRRGRCFFEKNGLVCKKLMEVMEKEHKGLTGRKEEGNRWKS